MLRDHPSGNLSPAVSARARDVRRSERVGAAVVAVQGLPTSRTQTQIYDRMDEAPEYLRRQLATAWSLTRIHLDGLTTDECLWRPAASGLHVHQLPDGRWHADWPEHERYDLGPSSIAWLTWHLGFWWSMVLDHSFGAGTLRREDVEWPGSADDTRAWIERLHRDWSDVVEQATSESLRSTEHTRWPFEARPFGDVVAWVNLELIKNAAEIGYARFLYAVRTV